MICLHSFPRGAVKLVMDYARSIDPQEMGECWEVMRMRQNDPEYIDSIHGFAQQVYEEKDNADALRSRRIVCYRLILSCVKVPPPQNDPAIAEILATPDMLFHRYITIWAQRPVIVLTQFDRELFRWYIKHGLKVDMLTCNSPFLEDFLKDDEPDEALRHNEKVRDRVEHAAILH